MNANKESPNQGFLQSVFSSPSEECRWPGSSRETINLIRVNSCLFVVFRRFLLHGCGLILSILPLVSWGEAKRPPNILWICGDDHAPYVIGAYGNKQVRTPNLDRLASQGMRFDRAFCNSPVCTASRQSFITGRYPRTIGVTQLKTPLSEREVTLADVLKQAG